MGKKVKNGDFIPLSNVEISKYMARRMGSKFMGCYARNNLPQLLSTGFYVVNLDDQHNPGTHWVGMSVVSSEIIYFDSFGFICPKEIITRKGDRVIWYSSHDIQNTRSVACGYYVLYFLSELNKGRVKNDILLDFENDGSLDNDTLLKNLLLGI